MTWQDAVLALGSTALALALIPTIRGSSKPALTTSLVTGSCLVAFSVVYASLVLWYAAATSVVSAAMWFVLAAQVVRRRGRLVDPE